jgi:hypothetical protein
MRASCVRSLTSCVAVADKDPSAQPRSQDNSRIHRRRARPTSVRCLELKQRCANPTELLPRTKSLRRRGLAGTLRPRLQSSRQARLLRAEHDPIDGDCERSKVVIMDEGLRECRRRRASHAPPSELDGSGGHGLVASVNTVRSCLTGEGCARSVRLDKMPLSNRRASQRFQAMMNSIANAVWFAFFLHCFLPLRGYYFIHRLLLSFL